ncbi:MAG: Transcription initiation factor TFIID subunit 5 [Trizodia sp. TS-e1964]|nr:MAG: Transcription initiation factor TFIID subunit 5 [Trizodia sp. TS-e1964]
MSSINQKVIEYLSKKGYSRTESMLRKESSHVDRDGRPIIFRAEDAGGDKYMRAFTMIRNYIDQSLDIYKLELTRILWPLFVYSYLNLVSDFYPKDSKKFFDTFKNLFVQEHPDDLRALSAVALPEHALESQVAKIYRSSKYRLTLSKMAFAALVQHLEAMENGGGSVIVSLLNNHLRVLTVDRDLVGADPRSIASLLSKEKDKESDIPAEDEGIPGHHPGSANTAENARDVLVKLKLGPLPMEHELAIDVLAELEEEDARAPPAPGQNSLVQEYEAHIKREATENSPTMIDVPLPPSLARDVIMEVQKVKEHRDRFRIEPRTSGTAPGVSIVMFTFHNTFGDITCIDISQDSYLIAAGTQESYIRVWHVEGKKIVGGIPPGPNDPKPSSSKRLIGHSAPVYSVAFSPSIINPNEPVDALVPSTRPRYLLSGSSDKTIRLWALETWTCVVVYKGHDGPVWDLKWGPYGHYFVSGSMDKTARIWSVDQIVWVRVCAGHDNDVDVVCWHPNSAYVFTASCDRTVRMFSLTTGNAVRLFTGHTGNITSMECSPNGKTLASADDAGSILIWDLETGRRVKRMRGHGKGGIWSLSFSVESNVLASAGSDGTVRIWDLVAPLGADGQGRVLGEGGTGIFKTDNAKKGKDVITPDQLHAFPTKKSPVYKVDFTRMNLVLAASAYLC